ncbi:MAG: FtsX-like permease family protein [Gemmatimonadaceae bacterium]
MLLICAGLFAQSLRRVEALDLGLDVDRTLIAKIDLGGTTLPREEVKSVYKAMLERVLALDGVAHAALAEHDPYRFGRAVGAHTPTRSPESLWHDEVLHVPMEAAVDSGFFRAIGATSLRGRDFQGTDRRGAPRVAIINEPLAKLLWPGAEPLGQCMLITWEGGDCVTVVGVLTGFWKWSILERDNLVVYVPMAQSDRFVRVGSMFIAARGDVEVVARDVRQAIQGVRPDLPAISVVPMREVLAPQLGPWQLAATMFMIFGGIALVIAAIGLYGVVAFAVAQRAPEIAIRIALGARAGHVLRVVARDGLSAVAAGLAVGGLVALGARRWLGPLLFQTSPSDPWIIAGVGMLLLAVATAASLIPTVQAVRRNPATVLRVG